MNTGVVHQRDSSNPKNNCDDNLASLLTSSSLHTDMEHSSSLSKPFKMNTYIQLDIDENNFNCLPRICKFLITKLKLDQDLHQSSVILAVKLEASKRSLRTLEIPLVGQQKADLNLLYNITYPHYLKKDTNLLYIYVQTRRKKYKTKSKTIQFGYKTLAYTFIDLANALQKPYSNDLPLFLRSTKNGSKQIIGYLSIQSLTSQPINDYDTTEDLDYDINSEIDSDTEQKKPSGKNNKSQLTGKIISFIRKLKNENSNQQKSIRSNDHTIENDNENSLIINEVYDIDYDENEDLDDDFYKNIEQVSDYANSDSDEPNFLLKDQDAYSIVSTPKPKLEPFYSQNFEDYDEKCLSLNFKRNYLLVENADMLTDNYVVRKNFTMIDLNELSKNLNESQMENLLKNKTIVKIFIIASTSSMLANYLKNFYLQLIKINSEYWRIFQNYYIQSNDKTQILNYLISCINDSNCLNNQMQIGEVMLHSENEESGLFVPFINSVSINQAEEESGQSQPKVISLSTSSSLPQFLNLNANNSQLTSKIINYKYSPPSSPNTNQDSPDLFYNLQIDYWISTNIINTSASSDNGEQDGEYQMTNNKLTLKSLFKNITIYKNNTPESNQYLTLSYCIKEKKQKIMRLSKKSKDIENKKETVDGISRLVCTSRNMNPINVWIDDVEYSSIKFLQVSSHWQGKTIYINMVKSYNC